MLHSFSVMDEEKERSKEKEPISKTGDSMTTRSHCSCNWRPTPVLYNKHRQLDCFSQKGANRRM